MEPSPKPSAFHDQRSWLLGWLFDVALPFWSERGLDRRDGGFFEVLADDAAPIEVPRRARLVSRQIYVFATAHRLGWTGPCAEIVEHGLAFLLGKMIRPNGTVIPSVRADGSIVRDEFDFYDCAFVLLALAAASRSRQDRDRLLERAATIRDRITEGWAHAVAGFHESRPPTAPLKSNPHMHLLEACLAWSELGTQDGNWDRLADRLVELCLAKFVDRKTGAVGEYFDLDWQPFAGGQVVSPGHQFEWAWLLLRWASLRGRDDVVPAALRLIEIGETHGTDATRGIAVDELNPDLTLRDGAARLWPQTERIKAWHRIAERAPGPAARRRALDRAAGAIAGLRRYFVGKPPGLWWETIRADGSFDPDPTRASSLYHLVGAADELSRPLRDGTQTE